ncbi:MAG TPA: LemA family protein [Chromobacteriaceae bacterium]|nr:LemA family protein [Chromobacteriaceae bacterium]
MLKQALATVVLVSSLSGCGYNTMQTQDEAANAAWSEVLNQYQRRADLIPNLVNTVKGYASHEQQVLTQVTAARARVGSLQVNQGTALDEKQLEQYTAAQRQLSSALSRLLVVSENYPQLKADGAFRDLQAQLEGTENRIALARNRYIQSVQAYNTTVRSFPSNLTALAFSLKPRPNFAVENERLLATPPSVNFGQPASSGH